MLLLVGVCEKLALEVAVLEKAEEKNDETPVTPLEVTLGVQEAKTTSEQRLNINLAFFMGDNRSFSIRNYTRKSLN